MFKNKRVNIYLVNYLKFYCVFLSFFFSISLIMSVKLISYTQTPDNNTNIEGLIAYCARVSNPSNQTNNTLVLCTKDTRDSKALRNTTNDKLLNYLIKNHHWSPFEMVNICLEIETTRDIARQILRHRSFSFQEFSQRYADPVKELDFVVRETRLQDTKNRQNSIETADEILQKEWDDKQLEIISQVKTAYQWAIENGIAKEQARAILPEGNTISRLYVNGTLRSWLHYIQLRCENGTQKEHIEIAKTCAEVISKVFPMILDFV